MSRRIIYCSGLAAALLFLASFISCDYSPPETFDESDFAPPAKPAARGRRQPVRDAVADSPKAPRRDDDTRKALLDSAMT